ncbi:hypothetical protein FS837_010595 [Tulasnella sp. UAMH 9824]|nr:hypothetical protein FS837_010595 [Tulasnella sp. UAMH 9824]
MKLPGATSAAGAALLSLFATTALIAPVVQANTNSTNSTTSTAHDDLQTLFSKKISYIVDTLTGKNSGSITKWLDTEQPNGQFTDVNYATGCTAQRSNWPAQQHWTRLRPIAAAYSDLVPHSSSLNQKPPKQFANNATVKQDLDLAMNWWFANDFNETSCLDKGGLSHPGTCPCSTPGMWNTNWFANVISIPQLSGEACLLYNGTLTAAQRTACVKIGDRAYVPPSTNVTGIGILTGANALDLAYVGVSTGLLKYFGGMGGGAEQVADAYRRTHAELVIKTGAREDGIMPDGSFSQHEGILATANLKLNLSLVQELGEMWQASAITDATYCLLKNTTFSNANANELVGNRMFWSNDYMNMKGFHLGQGVVFNYVSGTEYEDVAGAWDWNLIPGTTTAYGATPLTCDQTEWDGKESFVGGASNGKVGVAAMKWKHPMRADILAYQKAWFFFEGGVHHVLVPGVQSAAGTPVYSVLDQKRHNATGIYVDGQLLANNALSGNHSNINSLWYGGVGYAFDKSATGRGCASVTLKTGAQTGSWSDIGTSSAGNTTVDMFSAWIQHNSSSLEAPVSYSVYPGTKTHAEFEAKANNRSITVLRNDVAASAVLDAESQVLQAVFWGAGNVTIPAGLAEGENTNGTTFVVASNYPVTLLLDLVTGIGAVADPTQSLGNVTLTIGTPPSPIDAQQLNNDGGANTELQFGTIMVSLPQGPDAGRSVQVDFNSKNVNAAGSELHAREKKKKRYRIKRKQHQG